MKNKYIAYFMMILFIFLFLGLYLIEIPNPSILVEESYNLNLK